MSKIRFHKLAALAVLVGFAAWTATGEFSSVGSAQPDAEAKPAQAEQPKAPVRRVAVVVPQRVNHARAIRVSGKTEADKRAMLATRAAGIIASLPVKQGDHIKQGDLVLMLDAEEKAAAVDTARALLDERKGSWEARAERLVKSGNLPKLQARLPRGRPYTLAQGAVAGGRGRAFAQSGQGARSTASSTASASNWAAP